jgi:hypothetical protein
MNPEPGERVAITRAGLFLLRQGGANMRAGNSRWSALALVGVLAGAPTVHAEELRERVERVEQELRELREELRRRDERERGGVPASAAAPAVETPAPATAEPGKTAEAGKRPGYREVLDRVKLGAYGSFRYEMQSLEDQRSTFTFRRFVLTTDANIAPRLRGYLELEFERFRKLELEKSIEPAEGGLHAEQTVEGTSDSEIALEQAWLQYDVEDWLKFRGGGVLVPVGRFNINHDDNRWDLPRRSLVDRGVPVLPVASAWDELGVGFLGNVPLGRRGMLDYQAYVVNGAALDFEFEQIAATRTPKRDKTVVEVELEPATGTFGSDVKDAKAFTGRLNLSPWLGHEIAASGYYGQYTPDFLGEETLWSAALDGRTGFGPLELEGQYVFTRFDGVVSVARQLARVARDQAAESADPDLETEVEFELTNLARTKQGYWLEGRYRFWPAFLSDTFLGRRFDNPQLIAVLRGEQVWLGDQIEEAEFAGGRLTVFETDDRYVNRITAGLAYRPVPLVVFQLAYEFTKTNSGKSLAGVTNYLPAAPGEDHSHGVLLGAAFGF